MSHNNGGGQPGFTPQSGVDWDDFDARPRIVKEMFWYGYTNMQPTAGEYHQPLDYWMAMQWGFERAVATTYGTDHPQYGREWVPLKRRTDWRGLRGRTRRSRT